MKKLSRRSFIHNMSMGSSAMLVSLPAITDTCGTGNNNQNGKKLNIALCGLGRYAGILADGFAGSQYCRLAGIVTGTPAKAEQWKKQYNIPQQNIYNYENFDQIANNKDIDVVYIVLPNAMHKEFTIRTAKAGKHVIVEKPMATTAKDCQEMIDACKAAGV
jgi:predicted dehydrogenase